jgi:RNA recognition motif-containing protein
MESNKLYVGGLPYSVSETQLEDIFSAHGTVESARVITDRMTGRSRGFGFVEMSSQSEAEKATEELNESQLEGRTLVVNEARPRQNTGSGSRRTGYNDSHSRRRW